MSGLIKTSNKGHLSSLGDSVKDIEQHQHICLIYENLEERKEMLKTFFAAGLRQKQKCLYITNRHQSDNIINYHLIDEGFDYAQQLEQFVSVSGQDVFMFENKFDPYQAILFLMRQTLKALREDYSSLRVVCDMNWLVQQNPYLDLVLEYEEKLNRYLFPKYKCSLLCLYDYRVINPYLIRNIVTTHPFVTHHCRINYNSFFIPHSSRQKECGHLRSLLQKIEHDQNASPSPSSM